MISSYPPALDGVSSYCFKLCRALLTESKAIQILVLSNEQSDKSERGCRFSVVKAWSRGAFLNPLRAFRALIRWGPEVIHCQHEYWLYGRNVYSITFPLLLLILRILGRPIVITMHCVIPTEELTSGFFRRHNLGEHLTVVKKFYIILYTKLIGFLVTKIIVHLTTARCILVSEYGFKEEKVLVISHGIDRYTENPDIMKQRSKESLGVQDKRVLLFFGQVRRGKGLEFAIKAMPRIIAENSESILMIIGYYNLSVSPESIGYLEELMSLSKSLGLERRVIFGGHNIPDEKIPLYFSAADVFIFPYTEDEIVAASGPLSTALAFFKPIVATRIRRFMDCLKDGENALLIQPFDPDSLAHAVNSLLENKELSCRLCENVKSTVWGKSWEDIASMTLTLYNNLRSQRCE